MKFTEGCKVSCKKYGKGFCKKVDPKDRFLTYLFKFNDGTVIWMPKGEVEKFVNLT